jgi:Predicted N-acetylglucosaminyl transferase
MKKTFFLFLTAVILLQFGCGGSAVSGNNANAPGNSATENEQASNQAVPTFTNADEALAAGKKYLDENRTEAAINALEQATKLNPDLAEAHFQLGLAYALQESEDEALQKVTDEQTPEKSVKKGKTEEGVILTRSDKAFQAAAKAYEKIVKEDPKNAEAFYNLGRSYNKIQMDREAEKALRQAVKLKNDDSEYQMELGAILIKLARYDEAIRVLKKAIELDENNLRAASLLEKAEAGQKRLNFGIKPKLPAEAQKQRDEQSRSRSDQPGDETDAAPPTEKEQTPPPAPPKPTQTEKPL